MERGKALPRKHRLNVSCVIHYYYYFPVLFFDTIELDYDVLCGTVVFPEHIIFPGCHYLEFAFSDHRFADLTSALTVKQVKTLKNPIDANFNHIRRVTTNQINSVYMYSKLDSGVRRNCKVFFFFQIAKFTKDADSQQLQCSCEMPNEYYFRLIFFSLHLIHSYSPQLRIEINVLRRTWYICVLCVYNCFFSIVIFVLCLLWFHWCKEQGAQLNGIKNIQRLYSVHCTTLDAHTTAPLHTHTHSHTRTHDSLLIKQFRLLLLPILFDDNFFVFFFCFQHEIGSPSNSIF